MRPVQDGGLGMKRVFEYMEIPFETWESVGQMRMEFDKEGEMKTAWYKIEKNYLETSVCADVFLFW